MIKRRTATAHRSGTSHEGEVNVSAVITYCNIDFSFRALEMDDPIVLALSPAGKLPVSKHQALKENSLFQLFDESKIMNNTSQNV